jgi:two-component system response regulator YesN
MNVLLVDDEPLELEQLEYLIKQVFPAWNIYKAQDSSQAMAIYHNVKLQLAFLDIHLPGKSGLELAADMKANGGELDIVIVTAFQEFHYAKQSIKLGVIEYITKPIIQSELVVLLNRYQAKGSSTGYSRIIHDAINLMKEKYHEKINLADIASDIHVNPSYLSRRFHEEVGIAFSEYLMNYRIEMAKKLIINNQDWSISQVAERTGFNSQHYFSTIFRKMVGATPKEFREREKQRAV